MSALLNYVNDIIEQAYHDGASGVRDHLEITYLTEEDAAALILRELESGALDEWIHEYLLDFQEPEQPAQVFSVGDPVRVQVPAFTGAPCIGTVEAIDSLNQFPYFVRIDRYRGVWRGADELELA